MVGFLCLAACEAPVPLVDGEPLFSSNPATDFGERALVADYRGASLTLTGPLLVPSYKAPWFPDSPPEVVVVETEPRVRVLFTAERHWCKSEDALQLLVWLDREDLYEVTARDGVRGYAWPDEGAAYAVLRAGLRVERLETFGEWVRVEIEREGVLVRSWIRETDLDRVFYEAMPLPGEVSAEHSLPPGVILRGDPGGEPFAAERSLYEPLPAEILSQEGDWTLVRALTPELSIVGYVASEVVLEGPETRSSRHSRAKCFGCGNIFAPHRASEDIGVVVRDAPEGKPVGMLVSDATTADDHDWHMIEVGTPWGAVRAWAPPSDQFDDERLEGW